MTYQERLLLDIESSLEAARSMLTRDPGERNTELMSRLPNIRTQLLQSAMWTSELYGAMSQERVFK